MNGSAMAGGAALGVSAVAYVAMLAALRRADRDYPSTDPVENTWWFGYARDAANASGFLLFSGSFALLGLPGPMAFLAGASLALIAYGIDYLFGRRLTVTNAAIVTGSAVLALCALAAGLRAELARGLSLLLGGLF